MNPPTQKSVCLVLAGGGVKGAGMLGAIQYLHEKIIALPEIRAYVGTSIGAILGYLLCIGYTPLEIIHYVLRHELLAQLSRLGDDPHLLFSQCGLIQFEPINEFLELMTLSKHGRLFTLQSLFTELGKELACVTYNYSKLKSTILHKSTTPDLSCIQALQMSASIPYVFTQCVVDGQLYVDGGLVDNFPIRFALKLGMEKIIGVVSSLGSKEPEFSLVMVLTLAIIENTKRTIRKFHKRFPIIDVPMESDCLDFSLDLSGVMEMFSQGYRVCKQHFDSRDYEYNCEMLKSDTIAVYSSK